MTCPVTDAHSVQKLIQHPSSTSSVAILAQERGYVESLWSHRCPRRSATCLLGYLSAAFWQKSRQAAEDTLWATSLVILRCYLRISSVLSSCHFWVFLRCYRAAIFGYSFGVIELLIGYSLGVITVQIRRLHLPPLCGRLRLQVFA
eukprot:5730281-Amphidinium_carterae.1